MFIGTYNDCLSQRIRIFIPLSIVEKNREPERERKNVTGGWEALQRTWQLTNTCTHICTEWFLNPMSIVQWLNRQTVVEPFHTGPSVRFRVSHIFYLPCSDPWRQCDECDIISFCGWFIEWWAWHPCATRGFVAPTASLKIPGNPYGRPDTEWFSICWSNI